MVCLTQSLVGEVPTVLSSGDTEVNVKDCMKQSHDVATPTYQVLAGPNLYFTIGQCVHCTIVKVDDKQPLLSLIGEHYIDNSK